jgi:predicted Fe-Mo cluster-binding NifX family protein
MKRGVTATARDLDALIDSRFGRCQYFVIIDANAMSRHQQSMLQQPQQMSVESKVKEGEVEKPSEMVETLEKNLE